MQMLTLFKFTAVFCVPRKMMPYRRKAFMLQYVISYRQRCSSFESKNNACFALIRDDVRDVAFTKNDIP